MSAFEEVAEEVSRFGVTEREDGKISVITGCT